MPSGKTHDRITLWSLPLVVALIWAITRNSTLVLLTCGGFLFGGLMLGPDLDIHSVQFKRWGWLRWIWIPYRGSMRHRSPLSHAPIVGTVLRIVYLGLWLGIVGFVSLALANEIGQLGLTWADIRLLLNRSIQDYKLEWLSIALGLELGALSHYVADWGVSRYKSRHRSSSPPRKRNSRVRTSSKPSRRS